MKVTLNQNNSLQCFSKIQKTIENKIREISKKELSVTARFFAMYIALTAYPIGCMFISQPLISIPLIALSALSLFVFFFNPST